MTVPPPSWGGGAAAGRAEAAPGRTTGAAGRAPGVRGTKESRSVVLEAKRTRESMKAACGSLIEPVVSQYSTAASLSLRTIGAAIAEDPRLPMRCREAAV